MSPAEKSLNKLKSCMIVRADPRNMDEGIEVTPTGHIINSPDKVKYRYVEENRKKRNMLAIITKRRKLRSLMREMRLSPNLLVMNLRGI